MILSPGSFDEKSLLVWTLLQIFHCQSLFDSNSWLCFSVTNNLLRVNAKSLTNFLCNSFYAKENLLVKPSIFNLTCIIKILVCILKLYFL